MLAVSMLALALVSTLLLQATSGNMANRAVVSSIGQICSAASLKWRVQSRLSMMILAILPTSSQDLTMASRLYTGAAQPVVGGKQTQPFLAPPYFTTAMCPVTSLRLYMSRIPPMETCCSSLFTWRQNLELASMILGLQLKCSKRIGSTVLNRSSKLRDFRLPFHKQ